MKKNFEVPTSGVPWLTRVVNGSSVVAGTITFGRNADLIFVTFVALAYVAMMLLKYA